jgi:hypothetical protein
MYGMHRYRQTLLLVIRIILLKRNALLCYGNETRLLGQFYWWRKLEYSEKTIDLSQITAPEKDYLTTNFNLTIKIFNLTIKITLTIKNSSLGVIDTTLCDKVCQ